MLLGCHRLQRFGGSLWREGSYRAVCVGRSLVAALWWPALARRKRLGVVCRPGRGHSVLVARFGECGFRESCVGGRQVTAGVLVARFGEKNVPDGLHR